MSGESSVAGVSLGALAGPDGVAADPASEPLAIRRSARDKKGSPAEGCCEFRRAWAETEWRRRLAGISSRRCVDKQSRRRNRMR